MNKQLLTMAATAALMAMPSLASANDAGWYVRGNVGYGVMTDMDFAGDIIGDVEGEGNVAGSLGLGYEFGNNWRLELDAAQLWNDLGAISQATNTSADMRITTGMLNAIYDFSDFGAWQPYIGAGIGIARASVSAQVHSQPNSPLVPTNSPACPTFNSCVLHDADTATAWQLLAGLGYKINDNLTWDTQYRYLNVGELDYTGQGRNLQLPVLTTLGGPTEIASTVNGAGGHVIMTGLRYRFGASTPKVVAPPPPPPATPNLYACWDGSMVADLGTCPDRPAPEPPTIRCWDGTMVFDRGSCTAPPPPPPPPVSDPIVQYDPCSSGDLSFVVYFPWDKSILTDQAKAVVANASNTALQCNINDIIIEGHADSSGAASYNVGLSRRRATAVEGELRSTGLTTTNVVKSAKGEAALAVNTGDGVREPLNRRTEVVIRLIPGSYTYTQ